MDSLKNISKPALFKNLFKRELKAIHVQTRQNIIDMIVSDFNFMCLKAHIQIIKNRVHPEKVQEFINENKDIYHYPYSEKPLIWNSDENSLIFNVYDDKDFLVKYLIDFKFLENSNT